MIALKQVPHFIGYDPDPTIDFVYRHGNETTFTKINEALHHVTPGALIISLACLFTMLLWDSKYIKNIAAFKQVPSSLVVVVLGVLINLLYAKFFPSLELVNDLSEKTPNLVLVSLPVSENLTEFFQFFSFPKFSHLMKPEIYPVAFTIALIASVETLLNLEATDKLDPYKRVSPTNTELKAQGLGNMISGLIGGLPITQVIVRSAANVQAGGKTKRAAILHGAFLLLSVMFVPKLMNHIPLAALSVILILIVYKLAKPAIIKEIYNQGYEQFLPYLVTVVVIVMTDLLTGIAAGMLTAIFFILRSNYANPYAFNKTVNKDGACVTVVFPENVSFLNKSALKVLLKKVEDNSSLSIDATHSKRIEQDIIEVLKEFRTQAKTRGIKLKVEGIKDFDEEQASSFG